MIISEELLSLILNDEVKEWLFKEYNTSIITEPFLKLDTKEVWYFACTGLNMLGAVAYYKISGKFENRQYGKTEHEAVFKACEWIARERGILEGN